MRPRDLLPLVILGGIGAFIIVQARAVPSRPTPPGAPGAAASAAALSGNATGESQTRTVAVDAPGSAAAAPARDAEAVTRQIADGAGGTYFVEMTQQEQSFVRWPDRGLDRLPVWIERNTNVTNWRADFPVAAERAFGEWQEAGFPLRFDFLADSAGASIKIRWVDKVPTGTRAIGVTHKTRNQDYWIVAADIEIATHTNDGRLLTPETIFGVARHEIGHALGLGHSPSATDVMYPESSTPIISRADRATLHLLYSLPPGLVK